MVILLLTLRLGLLGTSTQAPLPSRLKARLTNPVCADKCVASVKATANARILSFILSSLASLGLQMKGRGPDAPSSEAPRSAFHGFNSRSRGRSHLRLMSSKRHY